MRYVSTRGSGDSVGFEEVLLSGIASDGGLFVPQHWPQLDLSDSWKNLTYSETVTRVVSPFVAGTLTDSELHELAENAYRRFSHPDVAPLRDLGSGEWLLELFWGPTLSFKDYALQLLGPLLDELLSRRGERVTVIGATSGDTGSAAIEALRDRPSVQVVILHPHGRVSEVQRQQMTTVPSANIHNLAVQGTFDDCQDIVKALFAGGVQGHQLAAVNSINWARIMAQAAYYYWAAARLDSLERGLAFSVPTGNFGNIYAGFAANSMGLPVEQLIVGNNANHGLATFLDSGTLPIAEVVPSLAPAMDIQIPSNLERLLFEVVERSGSTLARVMRSFRDEGELSVLRAQLNAQAPMMVGRWYDDQEIIEIIRSQYESDGSLIDPHTATGLASGRHLRARPDLPLVSIATAHPAKFPAAVEKATGITPELPDSLDDLADRPERCETIPADVESVRSWLESSVSI